MVQAREHDIVALADPTTEPTPENTRLVQFLALMLERMEVEVPALLAAIAEAELIVVAPSNPFVSIGTILAVPGIAEAIAGRALRPRHAHHVRFRDAEGGTLDDGIALYFAAPASFTGEDVAELQAHVKGKLAPYEYPKEIEFIDALPMTTTGKVQRRVLRLQEEARAAAGGAG